MTTVRSKARFLRPITTTKPVVPQPIVAPKEPNEITKDS